MLCRWVKLKNVERYLSQDISTRLHFLKRFNFDERMQVMHRKYPNFVGIDNQEHQNDTGHELLGLNIINSEYKTI